MASFRKLNVVLFGFPYGGNSGVSIEQSTVARWREQVVSEVHKDERIGNYYSQDMCDTPITMTRNRAVMRARELDADVLIMIDSDMSPDVHCYQNNQFDPKARPFFKTAFDFLYNHYDRGPVCLMAPYGGKGDVENMFVFRWRSLQNDNPDDSYFSLEQWTREEAWGASGIHDVAAGPTGLCMIDMRCFDITEPKVKDDPAWFEYEWTDQYKQSKASTEDVFFTRNLSLAGIQAWGYNPCKCLFDSWAGHNGFKVTRKPKLLTDADVNRRFYRAVHRNADRQEIDVNNLVTPLPKAKYSHAERKMAVEALEAIARRNLWTTDQMHEYVDGWNHTEADMAGLRGLAMGAKRQGETLLAVEVGSMLGGSAKTLVDAVDGEIVLRCVDTWQGSPDDPSMEVYENAGPECIFNRFKTRLESEIKSGQVTPVRMTSLEAAEKMSKTCGSTLDLVFIDAGHSYDDVKADIAAWLPLVRPGGILCGHDYGILGQTKPLREMFPGVRKAVDEAFGGEASVVDGTSIWVYRVPENNPPVVAEAACAFSGNGQSHIAAEDFEDDE